MVCLFPRGHCASQFSAEILFDLPRFLYTISCIWGVPSTDLLFSLSLSEDLRFLGFYTSQVLSGLSGMVSRTHAGLVYGARRACQ